MRTDQLNPGQLRLLIAILERVHFDRRQSSYRELARRSGMGFTNLILSIQKLADMGLIEKTGQGRGLKIKCRVEFFPESGLKPKPRV